MKLPAIAFALLLAQVAAGSHHHHKHHHKKNHHHHYDFDRALRGGGGCHDCSCFTCDHVSDMEDGTVNVVFTHCKDSSISWMCCVGYDGGRGNCDIVGGGAGSSCSGNKCETVSKYFTVNVPNDAKTVTINTHDGKTAGDAHIQSDVCGGNKDQGGKCVGGDVTAHCLIDFDLRDCGYVPPDTDDSPGDDVPPPSDDVPPVGDDAIPPGDDTTGDDVPPPTDDVPPVGDDAIPPDDGDDLPPPDDDTTGDDLPPPVGDDAIPPGDDVPPPTDDTPPVGDDAIPPEDDDVADDDKPGKKKVYVCHGTSSDKNPYNLLRISESALETHLSEAHNHGKKYHDYVPESNIVLEGKKYYLDKKCKLEPEDDDAPPGDDDTPIEDDDIPPPTPPTKPPTFITGDPHIKTFNGESFDFHGGCDLVLLHNPSFNNGQGLEIHVRTKITRWWSSIESAAIRIGDDVLEVKAGIQERPYWINGKKGMFQTSRHLPFTIGGFSGRFRQKSDLIVQYKIFLPDDQFILIRSVKDMLRVELDGADEAYFGKSLGLIGSYDGKFLGRDGVTEFEDVNEFGQAWQVQDIDPQLFQRLEGPQYPEKCAMPEMDGPSVSRRLATGSISPSEAKKACAHVASDDFDNCVSDVLAMDDVIAAEGY